jgi:RHS repeat-associated protein
MFRKCAETIAYGYDPASQVTNILHQLTATSATINQAAYAYNPVGNRTSLTDRRGSQAFGYDTLDRLTSASHPLLATPQAFAYDPVGNRTTGGSVVNAGNQLTADANYGYQYDDNGNLIRKTLLATGNYSQYTYDAENRLTKVEDFVAGNPTPAFTSTYRYDGLGRRIEKVANGQTKRYIYDGEDILLEYNGANVLQARYTHGPGIDEPIAVTKGGSTFFYHQDGLGTVTDLTDSTGATAKSYSYDAYGKILESPGTVEQPYTYTGREFDSETGLYYYRERYYDPSIGRFIHADPLGILAGVNLYAYVNNNPEAFTDPLGLIAPPSPPGEDICEDIRRIRNMGWWDIIANFSEGGTWDPKRLSKNYKAYGDWHYGVLMRARGTSAGLTLRGAGVYQLFGDLKKGYGWHNGEGWPWGDSPYGDYPEGQLWIGEGITDFDGGYLVHQCPNECPLPK